MRGLLSLCRLVLVHLRHGDHPREEKGAYSKSRGKMELLNLECSINNDNTGAGNARFVFFSSKCSMGFRF
jgi:hypothetical protein